MTQSTVNIIYIIVSQFVDIELLKKSGVSMKELKALEGKTSEEVIEILDLQCIDLQKKIDLTKYDIGKVRKTIEI